MAETAAEDVAEVIKEAVDLVAEGKGEGPVDETGIFVAYAALLIMALIPIYIGCHRSVISPEEKKRRKDNNEETEVMTQADAYWFPVYASGTLFSLYLLFKFFGKEYINILLSGYFFLLGLASLTSSLGPVLRPLLPKWFSSSPFHFVLGLNQTPTEASDEAVAKEEKDAGPKAISHLQVDVKFDYADVIAAAIAAVIGVWYLFTKHWIANNLFGMSFATNGISLLNIGSFTVGCILLSGLFLYDIFWVFGTEVMVTVATSFDAPIKVVFPKDFLTSGIFSSERPAMLGLGDIVIPGIVIALLLRFDTKLGRGTKTYFYTTFFAYIVGLCTTIFVMHVFKAAQPALLYLVPACLGAPLLMATIKGDLKELFSYSDEDEEGEKVEALKED